MLKRGQTPIAGLDFYFYKCRDFCCNSCFTVESLPTLTNLDEP
jgi:hypothetical protein